MYIYIAITNNYINDRTSFLRLRKGKKRGGELYANPINVKTRFYERIFY